MGAGGRRLTRVVPLLLIGLLGGCGGESPQGVTTASEVSSTTNASAGDTGISSTVPDTTTSATVSTTTSSSTPTTAVGLVFADLDVEQQRLVDSVCRGEFFDEITYLEVVTGASGVPELEEAFVELGADASDEDLHAAARPICDAIAWEPVGNTPTTDQAVVGMASVEAALGDVTVTGEVDGCPMTTILAGERWSTGRQTMADTDGGEWMVELMVDASVDPFGWSFSFTQSPHRVSSFHEFQSPPMESEIGSEVAVFETVFNDSLSTISGGWPDTTGVLTITCR